jgi:hypothetical protein
VYHTLVGGVGATYGLHDGGFKHEQHEQREQRVLPVVVETPQGHAEHLKHEERRQGLLLTRTALVVRSNIGHVSHLFLVQFAEARQGNVDRVVAPRVLHLLQHLAAGVALMTLQLSEQLRARTRSVELVVRCVVTVFPLLELEPRRIR